MDKFAEMVVPRYSSSKLEKPDSGMSLNESWKHGKQRELEKQVGRGVLSYTHVLGFLHQNVCVWCACDHVLVRG